VGRADDGLEHRDRAQATQACTGGGGEELGRGMGQGGQEGRLGEDHAAARLRGFAEEVGRRADLLVAWPEQEDELMDYERLCASAEAFVYAAMIRLMVRRLARA
jgi:hypothetical protein